MAAVLAAFWLVIAPARAQEGDTPSEPTAEQLAERQRELDHLLEDLRDTKLDLSRRQRAATILLDRRWPQADATLRRLLTRADDPGTPRAIARAVAACNKPAPTLVIPLLRLLETSDAQLRTDVAAALGRFEDPGLGRLVASIAMDPNRPTPHRLGATQTLAWYRTQMAASSLIVILDQVPPQSELSIAALASLAQLTGLHQLGGDVAAWNRWWSDVASLDEQAWGEQLMRNIASRNAELDQQLIVLTNRLTDTYTRLYDASAEEARQVILLQMLRDELVGIRYKGLKIVEQRVQNAQLTFSDGVLSAIRDRLFDTHAETRAQAASVLENLKDVPGAMLAAELLPTESQVPVQAALIKLLTRVPQRDAVQTILPLLSHAELRSAAATFLVAAFDANNLQPSDVQTALKTLRQRLTDGSGPVGPATLRLLGRIATPEDQPLIQAFLTGSDAPLASAAVEAFDNEAWPLEPLLEQLGNVQLQQAVWKVLAKRAQTGQALLRMIEHEPKAADRLPAWRSAVVSVVSRLTPAEVAVADEGLTSQASRREIQELVLKAGAGLHDETMPPINGNGAAAGAEATEARKSEAELRLAALYLRHNEPAKAKTLLSRLLERTSAPVEARRRAEMSLLDLLLTQSAYEDAAIHTRKLLAQADEALTRQLASQWLGAHDKAVAGNNPAVAANLATTTAAIFQDKLDPAARARLQESKGPAATP